MVALISGATLSSKEQPASQTTEKMAWWDEAKFGMFIHWGPYSMYGGVYKGHRQRRSGAEWIMNRCKIPVLEYRENASHFNPAAFDADALVRTAKQAGMKYLVFTTKHHDGFAMFWSEASRFNIMDWTPYGKDITDEIVQACRRAGMPFGFYYSQSQDWCNPGGAAGRKLMTMEGWNNPDSLLIDAYTARHHGHWDGFQDERTFDEYLHAVAIPQLKELLARYGNEMKIMFFDTPMRITKEQAQEIMDLFKPYPHIIFNDRLRRPDFPGDYKTPEQRLPTAKDVSGVYWETCMTIGSSWGYKSWDKSFKSPADIVNKLVTVAALGGNLLLNVGPMPTGELRTEETSCLDEVGKWMDRYGEAVYGAVRSEVEVPWGYVIRKDGQKASTLYLCVKEWPSDGRLVLPGKWSARKAVCLQDGSRVRFSRKAGTLTLSLPATAPEVSPAGTPAIIKMELGGKLPPVRLASNTERYFSIVDEGK